MLTRAGGRSKANKWQGRQRVTNNFFQLFVLVRLSLFCLHPLLSLPLHLSLSSLSALSVSLSRLYLSLSLSLLQLCPRLSQSSIHSLSQSFLPYLSPTPSIPPSLPSSLPPSLIFLPPLFLCLFVRSFARSFARSGFPPIGRSSRYSIVPPSVYSFVRSFARPFVRSPAEPTNGPQWRQSLYYGL